MSIFGVEEFETMFREEYRRCLSTALQIVGDAEAGRDIVSDSFAAVWKTGTTSMPKRCAATCMPVSETRLSPT